VLEETHIKDYINFMRSINVIAQDAIVFIKTPSYILMGKETS
jgi:hypothetical protein